MRQKIIRDRLKIAAAKAEKMKRKLLSEEPL